MSREASNIIKASAIGGSIGLATSRVPNSVGSKGAQHHGSDTSEITMHRNDQNVIEAIEIVCSCGQTTFVECVYPDQEKTS